MIIFCHYSGLFAVFPCKKGRLRHFTACFSPNYFFPLCVRTIRILCLYTRIHLAPIVQTPLSDLIFLCPDFSSDTLYFLTPQKRCRLLQQRRIRISVISWLSVMRKSSRTCLQNNYFVMNFHITISTK